MTQKRLVLCLDGTWNNAYQMRERDDGSEVLKPSNPLKMARAVVPLGGETAQLTYYDSGVGALGKYPGAWNRGLEFVDSKLGGAFGAGFEANIEQALTFLVNNYREGDQVFVFGFSRGAAQARGLARFLDWLGGVPAKSDAYFVPLFFKHYLLNRGGSEPGAVRTAGGLGPEKPMQPIRIEMLGVWDTVMALGSRFEADTGAGTSEASHSFHVGAKTPRCVAHARQALAIDERRYDFRPEIWRERHADQTLEQRWFAGVHANVGGGYVKDGLANVSFRWLLAEAQALGLVIDEEYADHYGPYPMDRLNDSYSSGYRLIETLRFRAGKGVRPLVGQPEEANLALDRSVVSRMNADPERHERLDRPYRPANVIEYLASKDDLRGYLVSLGISEEKARVPEDVTGEIGRLRGAG